MPRYLIYVDLPDEMPEDVEAGTPDEVIGDIIEEMGHELVIMGYIDEFDHGWIDTDAAGKRAREFAEYELGDPAWARAMLAAYFGDKQPSGGVNRGAYTNSDVPLF